MASEITVEVFDTYVYMSIKGEAGSPDLVKTQLDEILTLSIKENKHLILHRQTSVTLEISVFDMYYLAKMISESSFSKMIALVFPEDMQFQNLDFFETSANNRGITAKLFTELEDAINWLE